ncbi:zinc-binding dehydrogenase [Actinosynnema sp. CS-041913]|uniref:zinc-binding dehydrogenase n=1 Tax=Actinosynnema sp. CS-041913 TaxID=3239917 RepID=UPI003D8AC4D7
MIPTDDKDALVERAEVADPVPAPGEALVAVEAFSLNRADLIRLTGGPRFRPDPAWRPGDDLAGTVVRAATDGSGPAVGQRVVGYSPAGGAWAEYAAVATDRLAVPPDDVDAATATALPTAGITAARLLRSAGGLFARRVLLTGATGGVGHYVVELAVAAGAEITAVATADEPWQRLPELGATTVVHRIADAEGPFDVVLESIGGDHLPAALAKVRRGGLVLWFGQASGQPVTLNFFDYFSGHESAAVRQFTVYDSTTSWATDLAALVRLTATGRLHPQFGLHRWDEVNDVITLLDNRQLQGKAVFILAG